MNKRIIIPRSLYSCLSLFSVPLSLPPSSVFSCTMAFPASGYILKLIYLLLPIAAAHRTHRRRIASVVRNIPYCRRCRSRCQYLCRSCSSPRCDVAHPAGGGLGQYSCGFCYEVAQ